MLGSSVGVSLASKCALCPSETSILDTNWVTNLGGPTSLAPSIPAARSSVECTSTFCFYEYITNTKTKQKKHIKTKQINKSSGLVMFWLQSACFVKCRILSTHVQVRQFGQSLWVERVPNYSTASLAVENCPCCIAPKPL